MVLIRLSIALFVSYLFNTDPIHNAAIGNGKVLKQYNTLKNNSSMQNSALQWKSSARAVHYSAMEVEEQCSMGGGQ